MQLPSFVKDSSFKVGSANRTLVRRSIGQRANLAQSVKPPKGKNRAYVNGHGLSLLGPYALVLLSSRVHDLEKWTAVWPGEKQEGLSHQKRMDEQI